MSFLRLPVALCPPAGRFGLPTAIVLLLLLVVSPVRAEPAVSDVPATVVTETGRHAFAVELALSPAERARGLMNRESMAADRGMLFRFDTTRRVTMWMKSTLISLDMVFIRADGTIAGIHADAEPLSEAIIASPEPVRFVLELNAGTAERIGARAGDRVEHPVIAECCEG